MSHHDTMDVLAGFAVIAAMVLFFATAVARVEWWDTTWRIAVNPVRSEVPVSDEQLVDLGEFYWDWPGVVFNQTMTQVTFACDTAEESQLMGCYQVTFFEF
jgi:anti-sigma factor ChrR (cupin superfamily)